MRDEQTGRVLWRGLTVEPEVPADVERPSSIVRVGFLFVPPGTQEAGGADIVVGTVMDAIHPKDVDHVVLHIQVPEGEYEWLLDSQMVLYRRVEGERDG